MDPSENKGMFERHRERNADHDDAPWVCPGCYAMGNEEHAGYCVDAAIERDREEDIRLGRHYDDPNEDDDEDWPPAPSGASSEEG